MQPIQNIANVCSLGNYCCFLFSFQKDNNIAKDCLAKYSNAKGAPVVRTQQITGYSKLKGNQFQMFSTD